MFSILRLAHTRLEAGLISFLKLKLFKKLQTDFCKIILLWRCRGAMDYSKSEIKQFIHFSYDRVLLCMFEYLISLLLMTPPISYNWA